MGAVPTVSVVPRVGTDVGVCPYQAYLAAFLAVHGDILPALPALQVAALSCYALDTMPSTNA
eukprot:3937030-Rhodomonas_salina.1